MTVHAFVWGSSAALSSCQAKVSVRTVSGIEIRGDVSVIVLGKSLAKTQNRFMRDAD